MWSIDRLYPGERGHRLLAGAYFDLLVADGFRGHAAAVRRPSPPVRK